jgi:hypothetical protein
MRCGSGSPNMQLEFSASFAASDTRVPLEGQNLLARDRVPDFERLVFAAAGDAQPVGAEGNTGDR